MKAGTYYYNVLKQMVIDINADNDCANLRRPVIQGGIFEYCDQGFNSINIPASVITEFVGIAGFDANYYLIPNTNVPKTLNFSLSRILISNNDYPDISKSEARMWF
jgi:hypothetical protein